MFGQISFRAKLNNLSGKIHIFIGVENYIPDFLCMCELWPKFGRCVTLAKRSVLWMFPLGPAAYLVGTYFIDRNYSARSSATIEQLAKQMKEEENKVIVYPEGSRNSGQEFLPFKKGAFHIALRNKIPILPIVIGPYRFLSDNPFRFGTGRVHVTILPPVDTSQYKNVDVVKLLDHVRHQMKEEFEKLRKLDDE
ncbi:1-acyl-sn-glycerol-3-phosphate acyltransferase alpha [Folsomia candida]|uniref:1-acylglycerol-3-phosphate O-acyltransferase n=1 Tax=Folsomia candida TaxID=158441 RepID=A0A226D4V1_FOLCA|nr:1-acyl-sn-glycerol-3-phosphate acyltransferase alpha [Folsomia candida]